MPDPVRHLARARWALVLAAYAAAWLIFDRLRFPVQRDELHFWPTALRFSQSFLPGLELLRNYGELNTPLPFLLCGWLEHLFHGGIVVGRYLNLLLSLLMTVLVAHARKGMELSAAFATAGLLVFPYYLGVATHLYTDILAALFAVVGVRAHLMERYWLAAIAFVFGISTRQYVVAFPSALFVHDLLNSRSRTALLASAVAGSSLLGWIWFFGGFGPPGEVQKQAVATAPLLNVDIDHGLFFLSVIGLYYAVPEMILFRIPERAKLRLGRPHLLVAAALVLAFVIFPPLNNYGTTNTMGYFDKFIRAFLPDAARVGLFCVLALLIVLRFLREPLPLLLIGMHALMMVKAHVAWEKYALPLLVVLWFLRSRGRLEGSPRLAARSCA